MLLDKNVVEIEKLVSDEAYLRDKVGEAYGLLVNAPHPDASQ